MELKQRSFERQVAHKISIASALKGTFAKDDMSAGYLKLGGLSVSRVNIVASVVYRPENSSGSAMIDDGTGKIMIRNFNNLPSLAEFNVGDSVSVVGSYREFGNEPYIAAEVVRKVDPAWIKVRQTELGMGASKPVSDANSSGPDVLSMVRELDDGKGALLSRILEIQGNEDIKLKIDFLLKKGEIFEVSPGRLKVLE